MRSLLYIFILFLIIRMPLSANEPDVPLDHIQITFMVHGLERAYEDLYYYDKGSKRPLTLPFNRLSPEFKYTGPRLIEFYLKKDGTEHVVSKVEVLGDDKFLLLIFMQDLKESRLFCYPIKFLTKSHFGRGSFTFTNLCPNYDKVFLIVENINQELEKGNSFTYRSKNQTRRGMDLKLGSKKGESYEYLYESRLSYHQDLRNLILFYENKDKIIKMKLLKQYVK